jgi:hypothetical protein
VVIDPTWVTGADVWHTFTQTGVVCGSQNDPSVPDTHGWCRHRTGNSIFPGDLYWRSVIHFPYESSPAYGKAIASVRMLLWDVCCAGTSAYVGAYHATAWNFAGAYNPC